MIKLSENNVFRCLREKEVALIGFGVSHRPLAKLLSEKGVRLTVYDRKSVAELGDAAAALQKEGVTFVTGPDYLEKLTGEIIFRTPGMYFKHPRLMELRKEGAVITSEMELFFQCCPCPIIAVTGSDGKTTTTTLITEMLREAGLRVHLGGNIGKALFPEVPNIKPEDIAVAELSSFQLLSMRQSPEIAVVTNVSPNHLDVHGTMEEYVGTKRNLLLHQNAFGVAVLNADDETCYGFGEDVRGELRLFSRRHPVEHGAWMNEDGMLFMSDRGVVTPLLKRQELQLPGLHNVENFLTAVTAVWGLVPAEIIRKVGREFAGVEHRIEFVRELDGVRWYNDSIATSPTRTIAGLKAFGEKLILIAGGYDKDLDYTPLGRPILEGVKVLILTGATAPKIRRAAEETEGFSESGLRILEAEDLPAAVKLAQETACSGDIVTLSPASASFDRYPNFEVRGEHFKALVNTLTSVEGKE